jgi:hypothetical protein
VNLVEPLTIEERRPPTPTLEFSGALIQRCVAPSASVNTLVVVLVVFTCSRSFCPLFSEDAELHRDR